MSIHKNQKRKQFFICYKIYDDETGRYKTITLTNKNWTLDKGVKYMRSIEELVIEEDKKKRKIKARKANSITLDELVSQYENSLKLEFKYQTIYNKQVIINKHILPLFRKDRELSEILTVRNVEAYKNNIIALNLSPKRDNEIFRVFKDILNFACEREYITYDLFRKLSSLLKNVRDTGQVKEKLCFWTNEEWDKFYNSFEDTDKFKMLFEVDYKAALRLGELLALKWTDFDYNKRTLSITKSQDNLGNITTPKNSASNATVSLPQELCDKLVQFKIDTAGSDDDYIFFARHHTSRTTIRRVMEQHIETAGVPKIKFHGLRHSCASRMINAGCSPLLVSKHLRHASTQQTLDTYSHLFPSETVGLVDKVFG